MKRTQRHQLKENELARTLAATAEAIQQHRSRVLLAVVVVLLIAGGAAAITMWQRSSSAEAEMRLAEAMVVLNARVIPPTAPAEQPGQLPAAATMGAVGSYPSEAAKLTAALPKLQVAADEYPDTRPGITARYHYASALAALGSHDEAIQQFDEVMRRAGVNTLYGRMSWFGKADAQMRAGQIDAAIETWQALAASTDETLPKDAILMELARAYVAKGDQEEARKTFTQIVDEHPASPYSLEARTEAGS